MLQLLKNMLAKTGDQRWAPLNDVAPVVPTAADVAVRDPPWWRGKCPHCCWRGRVGPTMMTWHMGPTFDDVAHCGPTVDDMANVGPTCDDVASGSRHCLCGSGGSHNFWCVTYGPHSCWRSKSGPHMWGPLHFSKICTQRQHIFVLV